MTNPQLTSYSTVEGWKFFPLTSETRQGCHSHHSYSTYIGSHSQSNQASKRYKRHLIWKGRRKLSLFANDMILYTENSKNFTKDSRKTLKKQLHFYKLNMNYLKIIKKAIPFTVVCLKKKSVKYLGIHLTQEAASKVKEFSTFLCMWSCTSHLTEIIPFDTHLTTWDC